VKIWLAAPGNHLAFGYRRVKAAATTVTTSRWLPLLGQGYSSDLTREEGELETGLDLE